MQRNEATISSIEAEADKLYQDKEYFQANIDYIHAGQQFPKASPDDNRCEAKRSKALAMLASSKKDYANTCRHFSAVVARDKEVLLADYTALLSYSHALYTQNNSRLSFHPEPAFESAAQYAIHADKLMSELQLSVTDRKSAWLLIVKSCTQIDKFDTALNYVNLLIEHFPDDPSYKFDRADVFLKQHNYDAAIADYTELSSHNALRNEALSRRAQTYNLKNNAIKAAIDFSQIEGYVSERAYLTSVYRFTLKKCKFEAVAAELLILAYDQIDLVEACVRPSTILGQWLSGWDKMNKFYQCIEEMKHPKISISSSSSSLFNEYYTDKEGKDKKEQNPRHEIEQRYNAL